MTHIGLTTVVVRDYDEAITFYTAALGFEVREDTKLTGEATDGKRWVVVAPPGSRGSGLLLARAASPEQEASIGRQAGGRVGWFLHSDDFDRDHARMLAAGVTFEEVPRAEAYGRVAVFQDLYGNRWDLLEVPG
jgi:catechol 2,3-dioxygenase-like lactoylglutathione lyase family enzyme